MKKARADENACGGVKRLPDLAVKEPQPLVEEPAADEGTTENPAYRWLQHKIKKELMCAHRSKDGKNCQASYG